MMENNFDKQNSRIRNTCFSNRRLKKFLEDLLGSESLSEMAFVWSVNKPCLSAFTKDVQKDFIRIKDFIKENFDNGNLLKDLYELKISFEKKINTAA